MALAGNTPILVVGDRTFEWAQVQTAARLWGDWERVERQVREGLACLRFLEADERQLDPEVVKAAEEDFREERNLIAADEMNLWLDVRGIEVDQWFAFIERSVARRLHAAELQSVVAIYPAGSDEIAASVECEAICTGIAAATVRKLAATAVFAAKRNHRNATIDRLPAAFDDFRASAVTAASLNRMIKRRSLDWTILDCRLASFATEDAAREALHCVRDEGQELSDVARVAGAPEERSTFVLDDLPADTRTMLLSAETGTLLGPIDCNGRPTLVIVLEKSRPKLDNPVVRSRAEEAALAVAIERSSEGARVLLEL